MTQSPANIVYGFSGSAPAGHELAQRRVSWLAGGCKFGLFFPQAKIGGARVRAWAIFLKAKMALFQLVNGGYEGDFPVIYFRLLLIFVCLIYALEIMGKIGAFEKESKFPPGEKTSPCHRRGCRS